MRILIKEPLVLRVPDLVHNTWGLVLMFVLQILILISMYENLVVAIQSERYQERLFPHLRPSREERASG